MKSGLIVGGLFCATLVFSNQSQAADVSVQPDCGVKSQSQLGGGYEIDQLKVNAGGGGEAFGKGTMLAFGDAALGYRCNGWAGQIDGAYYHHAVSFNSTLDANFDLTDPEGHIGGAFYRYDDRIGRVGIAGSYVIGRTAVSLSGGGVPTPLLGEIVWLDNNFWRIGAFGDYYGSDKFTLGAGLFYVSGTPTLNIKNTGAVGSVNDRDVEGYLSAKYYPRNNIGLALRGDLLNLDLSVVGVNIPVWGYSINGEAEYLFSGNRVSAGLGARFANRHYNLDSAFSGSAVDISDTQVYANLKIAIGGPTPDSLIQRDRTGLYDNTSVFHEKLPNPVYDTLNSVAHLLLPHS